MAKFFEVKKPKRSSYRPNKRVSPAAGQNSQRVEALPIVRLSDDGRGIGSYQGKTIFVGNALPGEIVDADISLNKSHYGEGLAITIIQESTSRRTPACEYFNLCGGCHLQHLKVEEQRNLKLENLLNKLKHVSHIVPEYILPVLHGDEYHYRQRARLSVLYNKQGVRLGFRKKNSKDIININKCNVMIAEFNQVIEPVREWLGKHRPAVTHVEFAGREKSSGVVIRHTKPIELSLRKKLIEKLTKYEMTCWFQEQKAGDLTDINCLPVSPELNYKLQVMLKGSEREVVFLYHPQDFIQTNALVNQQMVNWAINFLQPKTDHTVLDLFCGVGNFSIPLSLFVNKVVGIEGVDTMVDKATKNAAINNCHNVSFKNANLFDEVIVDRLFKNIYSQKIDSLLLDPPRAGAKVVCENIKKIYPEKIVYISCEPNTFARDAKLLVDNAYKLEKISIMDMFPQTYHNEIISLFVLDKKSNRASTKKGFH